MFKGKGSQNRLVQAVVHALTYCFPLNHTGGFNEGQQNVKSLLANG